LASASTLKPKTLFMHHASIRTADIHRAIAFYEQLGFTVCERFTAGITLACWMEGLGGRIELLQVPQPRPAADAFADEHYTGYYHLSFDLTGIVEDLPQWLTDLKARFHEAADVDGQIEPLTVLLEPMQQMIGDRVYEVTFIADADGLPLEFIRVMGNVKSF
jgi:catechol 2,3-dioxygenase-like lactoylglutathione lyase family enzyme